MVLNYVFKSAHSYEIRPAKDLTDESALAFQVLEGLQIHIDDIAHECLLYPA